MNLEVWHIWVIVALIFGILEIFTPSFIAFSIAIGCLFSALGAGLEASFKIQLLLFSVGTAIAFFGVRPFMLKFAHKTSNAVKTNVEALVGKTGRVTETISNRLNTGRAVVEGDDWRVISEDDNPIDAGESIEVLKVDSTRLIVRKK
ncbi:MAG: NfeD family protein [Paludibacter sp.]|nr:NfeD family protein [Paludibacter sp.]